MQMIWQNLFQLYLPLLNSLEENNCIGIINVCMKAVRISNLITFDCNDKNIYLNKY